MEFDFRSFVIDNLNAAGTIGGYVAISIIGFAFISFLIKKKYDKKSNKIGPEWAHPIIGSFFGCIPGCGATIVIASLYKNKQISFGGLFAAFISTLGEGSFVLLGVSDEAEGVLGNLESYLIITVFGFITGLICGYVLDFFGLKFNSKIIEETKSTSKKWNSNSIENFSFYAIIILSIILMPSSIMAFWGDGIDLTIVLNNENLSLDIIYLASILLALTCLIYYILTSFVYKRHDCHCDHDNLKSVLSHAILDVSMVVSYVLIGLLVSNYFIDIIIGEDTFNQWMQSPVVFMIILFSGLIGVMPGCGGMIVVASAFLTVDNFPLSALITASIATSGDGIFPLLANNKKDGFLVSLFGLIIALMVGYLSYVLGF